jgi:hypothetical protein
MLRFPSMGMNTCISKMSDQGSDTFEHPRCGTYVVCCILYALPKLLSGVTIVGVKHVFHGTAQVKVIGLRLVTVVAATQEPWDHDGPIVWDNTCLITHVQPDWNVLEPLCKNHIHCRAQHPPIQINVCWENAGTSKFFWWDTWRNEMMMYDSAHTFNNFVHHADWTSFAK